MKCTCGAEGFEPSTLGPNRCSFCDGTEGGVGPASLSLDELIHEAEYNHLENFEGELIRRLREVREIVREFGWMCENSFPEWIENVLEGRKK